MITEMFKIALALFSKLIILVFIWMLLPFMGVNLHWGWLAGVFVAIGIAAYITGRAVAVSRRSSPSGGCEALVGATGKVVTALSPKGTVQLGREYWAALSSDHTVKAGEDVVVVRCEGLKLVVRPADSRDKG